MNIKMQNHKIKISEWKDYDPNQRKVIKEELKLMLLGGFLYRHAADKVVITENDNKETGIHELLASIAMEDMVEAIINVEVKNAKKENKNETDDEKL